ncbi:MAG: cation:proton antiporter [Candidatus Cloacimonetes bacterium]|nr:cation:proton antiporter [Candidatus Cloacimonadota bacterium]MCF8012753.1 cation:proton antiporter [Candidatus Woesearchaeota archaeon]
MDVLSILAVFTGIIIIGYFSELLFKKTRIPDVLILILIGVLLRYGLGWVTPESLGEGTQIFATFTLVFLLFQGSLSIDFKTLFNSLKGATLLTISSFFLTVIIIGILSMILFQFTFTNALLLGLILGGTSSAVVIPLVKSLPLGKKQGSTLTLESAISDVLCIIGSITMINILTTGDVSGIGVAGDILSSFALALFFGSILGIIWVYLLSKFEDLKEANMVTIAVVIGVYALLESPLFSASGAIGALAFGLILGNSKTVLKMFKKNIDSKTEEKISLSSVLNKSSHNFFEEISFFVKVFFFVYLGIMMDFSSITIYALSFIIVLGIYLIRPLAVKFAYRKEKLSDLDRTSLEILIPKGLAAAVLVQLTIQKGVIGAENLVSPVLAIIFLSILLTSILVILNSKGLFNGFWKIYKGKNVIKQVTKIEEK